MNAGEVFSKISHRQVIALMFHEQMADYFDFLNLHGYKRMHEYQYLSESIDMRLTHRYYINHYNQLVPLYPTENPKALPAAWHEQTRFDVKNKKELAISSFEKWQTWESETKSFLSDMYIALQQQKDVAGACFVVELIKDVDVELKGINRHLLELKSADTVDYILEIQGDLHQEYKSKTMFVGEKLKM